VEPMRKLADLITAVQGDPRTTMAVASGEDPATIHAIARAVLGGVIQVILVGSRNRIDTITKAHSSEFAEMVEVVHAENEEDCARLTVQLVNDGKADFLMKGLMGTATFMKAILDKETGLVPKEGLLSHVAVMEVATYPKLILVSDAAIIPNPNLDEKVQILKYAIQVAHSLGIVTPKAALVSAVEKISFKLQSSVDAAVIKAMAERKQIEGAIVDGPLALDVALSKKHCEIKGLESPINGESDILLFPNIETANTFYKSLTLFANGNSASVVVGAKAPAVLTSRADDDDSKFYSILLAARMASHKLKENSIESY
jgi:phosphate butyryltransferase